MLAFPPRKPALLPGRFNFGLVPPGTSITREAGINNWTSHTPTRVSFAEATAVLINDTSGGRFRLVALTVYNEQLVQVPSLPRPLPPLPPTSYELVEVAVSNGTQPLTVHRGQTVGATLTYHASTQADGATYTAAVQVLANGTPVATLLASVTEEAYDPTISWSLANPFGIAVQSLSAEVPLQGIWHAGRVTDCQVIGGRSAVAGSLLVGTDAGGIWNVQQPSSTVRPQALPLTNELDSPNIACLCQGTDDAEHFYAGTFAHAGTFGALVAAVYETALDQLGSGFHTISRWRDISPSGGFGTAVYQVAVTTGTPHRVVVASDTGVYWAALPSPGGTYTWQAVTTQSDGTTFPQEAYSGLATGSRDRVVVAAKGVNASTEHYGIFYGDWSPTGDLRMTRATLPSQNGTTFGTSMYRTYLASAPSAPSVLYAVAEGNTSKLFAVLSSSDNGQTWANQSATLSLGGQTLTSVTGELQSDSNKCIAASPFDANVVAIGWQHGHYLSRDGGKTWQSFTDPALHDDVRGLYFDPASQGQERLYICSDGGICLTADKGHTFDSSFNRHLANLECYATYPQRNFYGTLSATGQYLATGVQDNGNVYCDLSAEFGPWVQADGCDGGPVALLGTHQLISSNYCDGPTLGSTQLRTLDSFTPLEVSPGSTIPLRTAGADDPAGLSSYSLDPVTAPTYQNQAGQLVYAVMAPRATQQIYGLFARPDGSDPHWEELGSITSDVAADSITAIAALPSGASVMIGTQNGRLFLLQPAASGPVAGQQLTVDLPASARGQICRIVFPTPTLAFATYNNQAGTAQWRTPGGHILRYDGTRWTAADTGLPEGPYYGLAVDDGFSVNSPRFPGKIFTCTDDRVYVSRDSGNVWLNMSSGLPRRAHCAELRYVVGSRGRPLLYLSTYGRSVWVANVAG